MYLRNKWLYLICIGLLYSCDRSENQFDPQDVFGQFATSYSLVNANPGDTLYFVQEDMLDTLSPNKKVMMYWSNDTIIKNDTFNQLMIKDLDVDIILPEKLVLLVDDAGVRRHVKGYNYAIFQLLGISPEDTTKFYDFGVNPHWFIYWWKSPFEWVQINSTKRVQLTCGIDSFRQDADRAKSVEMKFVHGIGISKVDLYGLEVAPDNRIDTVKHFRLTRD